MGNAVMEIMEKRKSVRTYETTPIDTAAHASIMEYLDKEENLRGPFGGISGIEWIWAKGGAGEGKGMKLGAYGIIVNPQAYLVGSVRNGKLELLEFGYTFQKLILLRQGWVLEPAGLAEPLTANPLRVSWSLPKGRLFPALRR